MTNMGGEYHFPEPIIQHIQSFLTPKEAARTTVFSKSWGGAWLTRPNLDFDRSDFPRAPGLYEPDPLWQLADKTLKRYEDSNRKIESFGIRTNVIDSPEISMIARAFQIGATRLTVQNGGKYIDLPDEVAFGSENLVSLTVKGCVITHRLREQDDVVVRCRRLRSICLDRVFIPNAPSIARIISSCPLIERLSLSILNIYNHHRDVAINIVLPRLRSLVLTNVSFDALFFSFDKSTTFPSLKELTLSGYTRQEHVLISSRSLERLEFSLVVGDRSPMVTFDVPNLRKLTYRGSLFPELSFISTPTGLEETRVHVEHHQFLSSSWYLRLGTFLTTVRGSRIYIYLDFGYRSSFHNWKSGDIPFLPPVEIENLSINFENLLDCAVLDAFFQTCRPKLVAQSAPSTCCIRRKELLPNIDLLRDMILFKGLNKKMMYGLNDLEEAKAQIFDEDLSTWRDVAMDALSSKDNVKVRFQLKWHN